MFRSYTDGVYRTGNELTPGVKYDFKFKDYAPWVFRNLREKFHIDAADYLVRVFFFFINIMGCLLNMTSGRCHSQTNISCPN